MDESLTEDLKEEDFSSSLMAMPDDNMLLETDDFFKELSIQDVSAKIEPAKCEEKKDEEKKGDSPKEEIKNIYVNYDLLGGLEQIAETEDEDKETVVNFQKKPKSKTKQTPAFNNKNSDRKSSEKDKRSGEKLPAFTLSDEPDLMRIKS